MSIGPSPVIAAINPSCSSVACTGDDFDRAVHVDLLGITSDVTLVHEYCKNGTADDIKSTNDLKHSPRAD